MTTETSTKEAVSNVQPISASVDYSKSIAAKSLSTVTNSYKFAWRAWLGTAVSTQQTATGFVQRMAKKGEESETFARKKVSEKFEEAKSTSQTFRSKAANRVDLLEEKVGRSMGRSLHFIGVPTRGDVDRLALLMADMSSSIEELAAIEQQQMQSKPTTAKRPTSS